MNIATFNLNLLRTLDVLLEERNVSAAAQRLGLSQPAVSAGLTRLRIALDDRLLLRRGNRLELTPFAEGLRPKVRRILADMQRALSTFEAFDPQQDTRRFRIAATDYAAFVIVIPVAAKLRAMAPGISIDIHALDDRADVQLATGVCDLVVGGAGWLRRVASREVLFNEEYVSVARHDHPRLSPTVTLAEFLAERHVLISLHRRVLGVVDSALSKINQARVVGLTVPNFLLAPSAIAGSDMILTVGEHIATAFAQTLDLRIFPTPVSVKSYSVPMASHVRTEGDPAVEWLKQEIRKFTWELVGTVSPFQSRLQ